MEFTLNRLKKLTGKLFEIGHLLTVRDTYTLQTFIMAFTSITQFLLRLKRTFQ